MSARLHSQPLRFATRLGACLLAALVLGAAALDDLPGSVASRVKKIEAALTAADEALDLERLQTAQRKLKDTQRPLKEIADRYAGKFDEQHADYTAMLEHLAATTARVSAAEQASQAGDAAEAAAEAAHEAQCQEWIDALGPFVDRRSDDYLRIGADLNRVSPQEQEACKAAYRRARQLFDEYAQVQFEREKTIALRNIENSLTSALRYYGELESSAEQEAACREWVDLLAPYADVGLNSRRYLVVGATMDAQQLAERTAIHDEARAVFEIYLEAEHPHGKSFRLQTLEDALRAKLEAFPEAVAESRAMLSGDVGERLERLRRQLEANDAWRLDETLKPVVFMQRTLQPLREAVDAFAGTVGSDDARLAELRRTLAAIDARNAEHREVCAQRTFQRGDGYTGDDLAALKQQARAVAAQAHPRATLHQVSVPSADWSVEDVIEFTDTSRTALRRRVTRSVRAQVSLTAEDGAVWLQEVFLGQDRQPDGGWGALQGHTTWRDRMVPENLGKRPPSA